MVLVDHLDYLYVYFTVLIAIMYLLPKMTKHMFSWATGNNF